MRSPQKLAIIGHGGMGRELYQWILDINQHRPTFEVLGFLDDSALECAIPESRILGPVQLAKDLADTQFVLAINTPAARQGIVESLGLPAAAWADIVHPTCIIGQRCSHGPGLIMSPWACLSVDIQVGAHAHFNSRSGAGHDCMIGDYCSFGPNAVVLGGATLGDRVYLGSNAVVLPQARIGDDVTIGAGSTAMKTVRAGSTIYGSPGRRL